MNKGKKVWFTVAAVFIAVGAVAFIGAFASLRFDITKLSMQKYKTNCYELSEEFDNIAINAETATVKLLPSNEDKCRIECFEEEKLKHSASIQDNTLTIDTVDSRKWYDYIGFSFQTPTITVYLPNVEYAALSVKLQTGDIEIPDTFRFETVSVTGSTSAIACYASATKWIEISTTTGSILVDSSITGDMKLSATTGSIKLKQVVCNHLVAENRTGGILFENVIAEDSISVENTTGGVRFEGCDSADIRIKTSTGSVKGSFLSDKVFAVSTATGKVSVPDSAGGGKCEITTSTGDIIIEIK